MFLWCAYDLATLCMPIYIQPESFTNSHPSNLARWQYRYFTSNHTTSGAWVTLVRSCQFLNHLAKRAAIIIFIVFYINLSAYQCHFSEPVCFKVRRACFCSTWSHCSVSNQHISQLMWLQGMQATLTLISDGDCQ